MRAMSGKINEKAIRNVSNQDGLGGLLHAIFGLDHYPDYLKRWNLKEVDSFEEKLEEVLVKVREQKAKLILRQQLMKNYQPQLQKPQMIEEIFDPRFAKYISAGRLQAGRASELLVNERDEEVFSFPIFKPSFCELLLHEGLRAHTHLQESIATMQQDPSVSALQKDSTSGFVSNISVLDWGHLGWVNDALLEYVVSPLSKLLYPDESQGKNLDWRHGYIISYAAKDSATSAPPPPPTSSSPPSPSSSMDTTSASPPPPIRSHLNNHTDDSEVTLSICLGSDNFTGGEVVFKEFRNDPSFDHTSPPTLIRPIIGTAVIHRGRQLHAVLPVQSGQRHMLILWTRNHETYRSITCPCCWMNGRTDDVCICGTAWN